MGAHLNRLHAYLMAAVEQYDLKAGGARCTRFQASVPTGGGEKKGSKRRAGRPTTAPTDVSSTPRPRPIFTTSWSV